MQQIMHELKCVGIYRLLIECSLVRFVLEVQEIIQCPIVIQVLLRLHQRIHHGRDVPGALPQVLWVRRRYCWLGDLLLLKVFN